MKLVAAVVVLVLAVILAPLLFIVGEDAPRAVREENLPWQVTATDDGASRVFGLTLGRTTLDEARARLGKEMQVAVIAAPGQTGALEAYLESVTLGYVTGKLILAADLTAEEVAGLRDRAVKSEYMESTTRRYTLAGADLSRALATPVRSITFIPSAHLDEAVVLQRFGQPAERVRSAEHLEHFLYPAIGLDLTLDAKGKEVLQYVAPRDFERLRAPLQALGQ